MLYSKFEKKNRNKILIYQGYRYNLKKAGELVSLISLSAWIVLYSYPIF